MVCRTISTWRVLNRSFLQSDISSHHRWSGPLHTVHRRSCLDLRHIIECQTELFECFVLRRENDSGASLNSVRFRYFFLPISRSVVSSAVRLLDCGGVLSAFSLPQPRLMRWWTQSIDMPFCSASARSASV